MWHQERIGSFLIVLVFMVVLALPALAAEEVFHVSESGEPVQREPVVRIDPLLRQIVETGISQNTCNGSLEGLVEVNILLMPQGGDAIGRQVRMLHADRAAEIKTEITSLRRKGFPKGASLSPVEEQFFVRRWGQYLPAADRQRISELKQELETLTTETDNEITRQLRQAFTPSQDELCAFIQSIGGKVNSRLTAMNAVTAIVPLRRWSNCCPDIPWCSPSAPTGQANRNWTTSSAPPAPTRFTTTAR